MSTDEILRQIPSAEHPSDGSTRRSNSHGDSVSGSDSEMLPLTPSSGIVSRPGTDDEAAVKKDHEVINVDMIHGTEQTAATGMEVDTQAQNDPQQAVVEEEDEAAQYTQPAEFYPHEHVNKQILSWTIEAGVGCTPQEDPYATRGIPVFRPSMEEFADFEGYMEKVAPWGHRSGIVKVIPPKEWTESLPPITAEQLDHVKIKGAIQQNMQGRAGMYRANNIEKNKMKGLSVKDWWEKCQSKAHQGPGPKDIALGVRGRQEESSPSKRSTAGKRKRSMSVASSKGVTADSVSVRDDTGKEDTSKPTDDIETMSSDLSSRLTTEEPMKETETITDPWYRTFDLLKDWLPPDTTLEDFNVDACRELERKFWRGLSIGEPSWYGADLKGSLFTEDTTAWNVASLPNVLNRLNLKRKVPGVNTPYLYFGMWAAAFAWHVEDMDLYSINYIHAGAPKFWYAIPQGKAETFERHMAVSPSKLGGDSCRPNFLVQKQGEFVITYPKGYHAGFNGGFNIAESINFALEDWIDIGRRAKVCKCESHSVVIDIDRILQESELRNAADQQRAERRRLAELRKQGKLITSKRAPSGPSGGRMRLIPEVVVPRMAKPKYSCVFCPHLSTAGLLPIHKPSDKIRSLVKDPNAKPMAHVACARCIPELSIGTIEEDQAEDQAYIKKRAVVMGTEEITKERWSLKCSTCTDPNKAKMGAKIQCVKGKCARAYHVTCAMEDSEVEFEEVEVQEWVCKKAPPAELIPIVTNGETSTTAMDIDAPPVTEPAGQKQYSLVKIVHTKLFCPTHNATLQTARRHASRALLRDEILRLPVGYPIVVRSASGNFESYLLFLSEKDETAGVVGDDGSPEVVKWSQLELHPDGNKALEPVPTSSSFLFLRSPLGVLLLISHILTADASPVDFANVALTPEMIRMLSSNRLLQMALQSVAV
ncbi:hypothetical protein QFC21_006037 [Naganishia friedmannii]|uniref:Uncharacterized protein n=1 Tax=Naganishia friedmannii TaxID=89922 RepID=A0ACC2V666_9TREE|nr:hypothetical protein QFC21_006037 [Naganishia friedmannii]